MPGQALDHRSTTGRRADGWWYPWIFVVGMLVVIAANGVLITCAIATFPGLESDDAYREGLAYNTTLAAARAQQERGWQAQVGFAPGMKSAGHGGDLTVAFLDRDGQPMRDLDVVAVLIRPTNRGSDVSVELDHRGQGVYGAAVALPLPGQWDARIVAHRGTDDFQQTRRIFVP